MSLLFYFVCVWLENARILDDTFNTFTRTNIYFLSSFFLARFVEFLLCFEFNLLVGSFISFYCSKHPFSSSRSLSLSQSLVCSFSSSKNNKNSNSYIHNWNWTKTNQLSLFSMCYEHQTWRMTFESELINKLRL